MSSDTGGMIPFPPGNNDTDTAFGGGHFNLTALKDLDYHLFENGTVSNHSRCLLAFEPHTPAYFFPNGTWVNYTSCYTAIYPIGTRAKTGVGIGALYALALFFIIFNLRKHGSLYLPREKRFFPISRRWQWYWGSIVCAFALIGLFFNVDVDRYYIMEIPIIITSFFWFLLQQAGMALVWEAVRHWGSWNERQIVDADPSVFREEGRRYTIQLLIPLWFYLWVWLNFFLVIPRTWGHIQMQRTLEQTLSIAKPAATDGRFKAAAFCLLVAWLTIVASLAYSIKLFHPRRKGSVNKTIDSLRAIPLRFYLIIPLALVVVAYQALAAFHFEYSPLNVSGDIAAIYAGGYLPILLILLVQIIYGWRAPNEDKELIRQRRARGEELDRDLGIVHKPAWWKRVKHGNGPSSMRDIIEQNVNEVGGRTRTGARPANPLAAQNADEVELADMSASPRPTGLPPTGIPRQEVTSERPRSRLTVQDAADVLLSPSEPAPTRAGVVREPEDEPPPSYNESTGRLGSVSADERQAQNIRSMLDV